MRDLETSVPFIHHLRAEHAQLNHALRDLQKAVLAPAEKPTMLVEWQKTVAARTRILREHAAHHFAAEEAGGCLEEAVSRCPSLAGEMEHLEKEHPTLLAKVDHLLAMTERPQRRPGIVALIRAEFDEFACALATHEEREHKLVERGLSYATDDLDPQR